MRSFDSWNTWTPMCHTLCYVLGIYFEQDKVLALQSGRIYRKVKSVNGCNQGSKSRFHRGSWDGRWYQTHTGSFSDHTQPPPGGGGSVLSISLTSSKLPLPAPSNERCGVWGVLFVLWGVWLCRVFAAVCELSLAAVSRGCSLAAVRGLLIAVASLVGHGL